MQVKLDLGLYPRQLQALETDAQDLLFGGMSEGGKSHFLRCALIIYCLQIPNLQCVLIRKKFADIELNHVHGPTGFRNLLKPLIDLKKVDITQDGIKFWNGSMIYFLHCQDERQFDSAQGVERHVVAIDEATQIGERLIRFFRAWCRMTPEMRASLPDHWKNKFPKIICTANPIGPSVPYFRREYVQARPHETIELVHGFKRQYIPSSYKDNLSVDVEAHIGRMQGLGDVALIKALDEGDWNAMQGDFFPEWSESKHVCEDFIPPPHWTRFRSFDWGTADPFAVYWCCFSDGQVFIDSSNTKRWFPKGALILYAEWYGCDPQEPVKGIRMRNEDIAEGIWNRSDSTSRNTPILTDSLPFQDRGGQTIAETFHDTFKRLGSTAFLVQADTSRVTGWSQMRSRLIGIEIDANDGFRTPMLYVTESCKYARDYIPALTRHPSESKKEDAAEHGEATHAADAIRYACMAHTVVKTRVDPVKTDDLFKVKPSTKSLLKSDYKRFFV